MTRIEIGHCPVCGRLRDVSIDTDPDGRATVTLLCMACQQIEPETHTFEAGEGYYLDIGKVTPTKREEGPHEDPDQSDL